MSTDEIDFSYGAKFGTLYFILFTIVLSLSGSLYTVSSLVFVMMFVLFFVIKSFFLFFEEASYEIRIIQRIPSLQEIHIYLCSASVYCKNLGKILLGKSKELSWNATYLQEEKYIQEVQRKNRDTSNMKQKISPRFGYVPLLNLLLLVIAWKNRKILYGYHLLQGIALTIILCTLFYLHSYITFAVVLLLCIYGIIYMPR